MLKAVGEDPTGIQRRGVYSPGIEVAAMCQERCVRLGLGIGKGKGVAVAGRDAAVVPTSVRTSTASLLSVRHSVTSKCTHLPPQRHLHSVNSTTSPPQVTSTASPPQRHLHNVTSTASLPQRHLHSITSTASPPQRHFHSITSTASICTARSTCWRRLVPARRRGRASSWPRQARRSARGRRPTLSPRMTPWAIGLGQREPYCCCCCCSAEPGGIRTHAAAALRSCNAALRALC